MHAVFLYHAIRNGLDMAIVNPATSITYDDLPTETLALIEDVVLNRRPERRTSHRLRRETSGRSSQKRKQYRRRPSSATCRRPTETSSRQRHIDTPRNRPRRGRPSIRLGTRRHRATPHGRHEPGGTTFRRRENVPSPSRQERPHHEASSGYIATTHRAGKYPQWRNLQTGKIHCSHSQGRCARHREKHRCRLSPATTSR